MSTVSQAEPVSEEPTEQPERDYEYRKGMKYQTMYADDRILHESDRSLLPEGATIIKSVYEPTYEQVSYIVQYDYETWCRVKVNGKYGKKYIWGMVNEDAEYFISLIAMLYELEKEYRLRHLTTEQIRQERQGEKTAKIIHQLRQRLDKLLADSSGMRGKLMQGALAYMNKYWDQLFLYLKDGRYNIDNSLAERMLRPMTIERKNSLTFGSHAGVEVSVIYHTFIETCKMCGVSTLEYFKEFFKAIMLGRTDYENMLPMTIGIKK